MKVIKKVRPQFTGLITTMNMLEEKDMYIKGTSLIDGRKIKKSIDEFQTVVAVVHP